MISLPANKVPRYERKYLINELQAQKLKFILDTLCDKDKHLQGRETYNIRSLYFDDYFRNSYMDNEIGIEPRSKFRIRIYDSQDSFISLEQKIKIAGKIYKKRETISKEFFDAVLRGDYEEIEYPNTSPLVNQFLTAHYTKKLEPSVIVDYDREPYVYPDGDVRITFDRAIAFSNEFEDFFDPEMPLQPILPLGMQLLEVKYTEFIPEFIHQQLNNLNLKQCTFSKYYLCEKYKRMGEF